MRVFDTLTRQLREFEPLETGVVRMYTCGPTVYDFAHLGNFRTYVWEDLLRRTLKTAGYRVVQVMNITDIEDKIIRRMMEEGIGFAEATEPYIRAFFEDLDTLRIERAEHYPRATEHIPEMIALARALEERGHTYTSQGSLYFRIGSFPGYGRLSHLDGREIKVGARIDSDEYEKNDARDFVLWKGHRPGEPAWDSPWGPGRPGWHLECSAMSMKYLGEGFDLHTGGVDNIFPHHENEIAQSECATGHPFVKYWMHAAHLMVNGEKMSKSKGNFHTLRDLLEKGYDPRAIRWLLLTTHYRSPLNFTLAGLEQAGAELSRLEGFADRLRREPSAPGRNPDLEARIRTETSEFRARLEDDLDVTGGVGAMFRLVRECHAAMDRGELPSDTRDLASAAFGEFDRVLAVLEPNADPLDAEIERWIAARTEARKRRDFAESDRIRDLLAARGIVLEDTPHGVRWRRRVVPRSGG